MPGYQFADYEFDTAQKLLCLKNSVDSDGPRCIPLRNKVAKLLCYLIENRERVVSKEELLDAIWAQNVLRENSLTQSVRELRSVLNDNAQSPEYIKTFTQLGYRWVCETSAITTEAAEVAVQPRHQSQLAKRFWMVLLGVLFVVVLGGYLLSNADSGVSLEKQKITKNSLMILPLNNATNDPSMSWLELGLADMLAVTLQGDSRIQVTSPASGRLLLVEKGLSWPASRIQIKAILEEQGIAAALLGSVRLYDGQQVLDFMIVYANGDVKQGSMAFASLPAEVLKISRQIITLMLSEDPVGQLQVKGEPVESLAIAQGLAQFYQSGPLLAQKYFKAALEINKHNYWTYIYLANAQLASGQWQLATQTLEHISQSAMDKDAYLNAYVYFLQSEIAFRRGVLAPQQIERTIEQVKRSTNVELLARSFRLQASLAATLGDWHGYQSWSEQANALATVDDMFYFTTDFLLLDASEHSLDKNLISYLYRKNKGEFEKQTNGHKYDLLNGKLQADVNMSIGINPEYSLQTRHQSLKKAVALYRSYHFRWELAHALYYLGKFSYKDECELSRGYFLEAQTIAIELDAQYLRKFIKKMLDNRQCNIN
ncbi:winged helix-turn-helix domain-containing protein [Pseudoalteromonas sp. T1lg23B]|uniref:winged helix-turn-helix domain-containing protein n=1 Tax=Pseudoalteromonas sp. T1lg23B TaxID=2077097 RepID=UPI000CF62D3B|nr:winged helix-turn-helix domain-containing protein [Pseudoalteromonas sp. T1lg23B]